MYVFTHPISVCKKTHPESTWPPCFEGAGWLLLLLLLSSLRRVSPRLGAGQFILLLLLLLLLPGGESAAGAAATAPAHTKHPRAPPPRFSQPLLYLSFSSEKQPSLLSSSSYFSPLQLFQQFSTIQHSSTLTYPRAPPSMYYYYYGTYTPRGTTISRHMLVTGAIAGVTRVSARSYNTHTREYLYIYIYIYIYTYMYTHCYIGCCGRASGQRTGRERQ